MRATHLLSFLPALALADHTVTFPLVGTGEAGATIAGFANYTATVITVQSSMTTYAIACATGPCDDYILDDDNPTFTLAVGPNSHEVFYTMSEISVKDGCSYSGSKARCAATGYSVDGLGTSTTSYSYAVPTSNMVVQTAVLKVVDGKGTGAAVAGRSVEAWMVAAGIGFWGAFIGF